MKNSSRFILSKIYIYRYIILREYEHMKCVVKIGLKFFHLRGNLGDSGVVTPSLPTVDRLTAVASQQFRAVGLNVCLSVLLSLSLSLSLEGTVHTALNTVFI